MRRYFFNPNTVVFLFAIICCSGCAPLHRSGFIEDPETGIQYGSVVERNIFLDASQFENKKIKVTLRNVSGEASYDLTYFKSELEKRFQSKGYLPSSSDDFGIKLDVNVLNSGHVQRNMQKEYAFLGGSAGGIVGYRSNAEAGTAIGILSGATLGSIIGSYVTEDTYIVIAQVSIGVSGPISDKNKRKVTFGSSPKLQKDYNEGYSKGITPFKQVLRTNVAVYAGGRNVSHGDVVDRVKRRLVRIVSDII